MGVWVCMCVCVLERAPHACLCSCRRWRLVDWCNTPASYKVIKMHLIFMHAADSDNDQQQQQQQKLSKTSSHSIHWTAPPPTHARTHATQATTNWRAAIRAAFTLHKMSNFTCSLAAAGVESVRERESKIGGDRRRTSKCKAQWEFAYE